METAKVDIRKLQLLNDRINQCLDALSQVRLSVYGLSHTPAAGPLGAGVQGYGAQGYQGNFDPRFTDPRFAFSASPITPGFGGAQTAGWIGPGFASGLSHTPFVQPPLAGFSPMVGAGNIPLANPIPIPSWNMPIGLSHTGLEAESVYNRPLVSDPFLAVKVAQTFPYAQFSLPPVVPVY